MAELITRGDNFTQADIDETKGDAKHVLVSIGYLGSFRCYLDLSLAEIKQRHGDFEDEDVQILSFDDEFCSYEVSAKEG